MLREDRENLIGFFYGWCVAMAIALIVMLCVSKNTKQRAPEESTEEPEDSVVSAYKEREGEPNPLELGRLGSGLGISKVKVEGHEYLKFYWHNSEEYATPHRAHAIPIGLGRLKSHPLTNQQSSRGTVYNWISPDYKGTFKEEFVDRFVDGEGWVVHFWY